MAAIAVTLAVSDRLVPNAAPAVDDALRYLRYALAAAVGMLFAPWVMLRCGLARARPSDGLAPAGHGA